MESGGKEIKQVDNTDKQIPLPPLSDHEIDSMQKADMSTGWDCLQLLLLNPALSQRLGSREESWLKARFETMTVHWARQAIQTEANPLRPG